jgi:stress-induced-phosphoprotein 1
MGFVLASLTGKAPSEFGGSASTANAPKDPRVLEAIVQLLGVNGGDDDEESAGSGSGFPGGFPSSAPPAPSAAELKKRKEQEEAERKRKEQEEKEASMTDEERAKLAQKKEAAAVKDQGNTHYKAKQFDQALECYTKACELDPEDITYRLNIAAVQFERADYDACIQTCRDAVTRGREVFASFTLIARAFARIGNALLKKGDLRAAIGAYEDSLTESHSDEVYDKIKKCKAELKKKEEQEYLDPVKAAAAKDRGNEAFKAGNFPKSIQEYTEAVQRDPTNAIYYTNRATARAKLMDFSNALEDCEKALKLDPKYAKAWLRRGTIQVFLKEYHKALETFQMVLQLEPDNAEAKRGLAETVSKINSSQGSTEADPERAARAMSDPEIQAILRDPMVNQAIQDMQKDPQALRNVMNDPNMAAKIQKLIAAGVLRVA